MPLRSFSFAFVLLLAAFLAPTGTADAQSDEQCQISNSTAEPLSQSDVENAVSGQLLSAGDRIRTNATGRATITCSTGLTIILGGDTDIVLDRIMTPNRPNAGVRLLEGIAGFLLPQPRSGGFEVRTPSAIAAVRSTEWAIDVDRTATAAFVRDGAVSLTASGGSVLLTPGEGVDVDSTGGVGQVVAWSESRIATVDQRLGADWQTPAQ